MIIEQLRDAILNKSWTHVAKVFEQLTGEVIEVADNDVAEALKELDQIKARLLGTTQIKPTPVKSANLFDPADLELDPEPGYDAINDNVKRTPRRKPYTPKKVSCSECSKTFEVNPKIATSDVYTCDKCISRRIPR